MMSPDNKALRRKVAEAIESAIPVNATLAPVLASFVRDGIDCPMDRIDMDSLGYMEFCIALELSLGVALTPEDLHAAQSLCGVVELVATRT